MLDKYFDKIFCINLERRSDKWAECLVEFDKWGVTGVNHYLAVDGSLLSDAELANVPINRGELGLLLTHINIFNEAIINGYDNILLLEDDISFNDNLTKLGEYMSYVPKDWDILYLGGNHNQHVGKTVDFINERVIKSTDTYTTHCIAVNSSMYEIILSLLNKKKKAVDVYYSDIQKTFNCYSFYPGVASQRPSFSDIQNKIMDNRWLIK